MPVQLDLPLNAKLALEVDQESPLPDHNAERVSAAARP
jgi:hypothetical protein